MTEPFAALPRREAPPEFLPLRDRILAVLATGPASTSSLTLLTDSKEFAVNQAISGLIAEGRVRPHVLIPGTLRRDQRWELGAWAAAPRPADTGPVVTFGCDPYAPFHEQGTVTKVPPRPFLAPVVRDTARAVARLATAAQEDRWSERPASKPSPRRFITTASGLRLSMEPE